jgi:hypothetical protein
MCDHNRDNADPHMEFMRIHCDQIQNQSNTRIRELERQNIELQATIRRLQDQLNTAARRPSNVPALVRELQQQQGGPLDRSFGDMTTLSNHTEAVFAILLSPATWRIFSGSRDKTINMYDAFSNVCCHTLRGHDGTVTSLAISRQGDPVTLPSRFGRQSNLYNVCRP